MQLHLVESRFGNVGQLINSALVNIQDVLDKSLDMAEMRSAALIELGQGWLLQSADSRNAKR